MFGRYLKVELGNLSFTSNFDRDEKGGNASRIAVECSLQRNFYTSGKITLYNLKQDNIRKLQDFDYDVKVYAGWSDDGNGLIVQAKKTFVLPLRIGTDLIAEIYFLNNGLNKNVEPISVRSKNLQVLLKEICNTNGYTASFYQQFGSDINVSNKSLRGNFFDKLTTLKNTYNFNYFIQANNVTFQAEGLDFSNNTDFTEISPDEGLLTIPVYTNLDFQLQFENMLNNNLKIGNRVKLVNKYLRFQQDDGKKIFVGDLLQEKLRNIEGVVFNIEDIDYKLDTRGEDFKMAIKAYNREGQRTS